MIRELKQDVNRELNPGFGTRVVRQKQCVLSATTLTQTHALHPFLLPFFTLEGVGYGVTPACPLLSLLCSKSQPSCLLKDYQSSFLFHVSLASLAFKHSQASGVLKLQNNPFPDPTPLPSHYPSALPFFIAKSIEKHVIVTVFSPSNWSENLWRECACINS